MVEFGPKLDEKMEVVLRETKENVQGTNSDGKETGTQINALEHKGEKKHSIRTERRKKNPKE